MDRSQKAECGRPARTRPSTRSAWWSITRNLGMTVAQSTDLRTKMREAGASYKVAKNRLAKLAIEDTDYAGIDDMLTGPDRARHFGRSGGRRQGRCGLRQDERQARNRRRRDGSAGSRMPKGSRRSPRCRRSTNCAPSLSASSRHRRPRSPSSSTAPAAKLARVFGAYAAKEAA